MGVFRCNDDEPFTYDHEGYAVMVVPDGYEWRELGLLRDGLHDDFEIPKDKHGFPVSFRVQVACSCGWRSQRMGAPLGTEWMPYCVLWPTALSGERPWEDVVCDIWASQHRDHVTDASDSLWRVARLMPAGSSV